MTKNRKAGHKINSKNIPSQLKEQNHWVGWKSEKDNGRLTKVPYNPTTEERASSTNPETWVDFKTLRKKPKYRLGFVLTNTPFTGIDLDKCRDPETGEITAEAQKIVDQINSYTEVSPSGTGLHIIVRGSFTGGSNRTTNVKDFEELEMYHTDQYFTVTGQILNGIKPTIEPRKDKLTELYEKFFNEQKDEEKIDFGDREGNELSDDEVLRKAKKSDDNLFTILWNGNMEKYKETAKEMEWDSSQSGADYHLCRKLAFYTGGDPQQIERLLNQSQLVRPKWERGDNYLRDTITKVLNRQNEFYEKPGRKPPNEPPSTGKTKPPPDDEEDLSQHQKLLEIVKKANLFKTGNERKFGEVTEDDQSYLFEIKTKGAAGDKFRQWLTRRYEKKFDEGPSTTGISRTMNVVRAKAEAAGRREIYKRVADLGDRVLIDLAGDRRKAVEITPSGYKITEKPDINFWRPSNSKALPEPEGNVENLEYLRELTNTNSQEDFSLLIAWLLMALQRKGPYPVLIPTGPAGSAKSTMTKMVRKLLDPAGNTGKATTNSIKQSEDVYSVAKNRHILALDNISKLRRWQSDALSAIATGGGLEKRRLYTDSSVETIDTMNPVVMNGIDISGIGDDLLDRAIFLHLKEPTKRMEEDEIWNNFDNYHGKILGGLCDILSTALKRRNSIELTQEEISRMADFTKVVKAAQPAIQKIEGLENIDPLEKYHENRTTAGRDALMESDLGTALVEFLESQEEDEKGTVWKGKTGELLEELEKDIPDKTTDSKKWPSTAAVLGKKLSRLRTSLKKVDFILEKKREEEGMVNEFYREVPF